MTGDDDENDQLHQLLRAQSPENALDQAGLSDLLTTPYGLAMMASVLSIEGGREATAEEHADARELVELLTGEGLVGIVRLRAAMRPFLHADASSGEIVPIPNTKMLSALNVASRRVLQDAVTLGVVKTNPARRLYERLGFRITHEDDRKFYMRRETFTAS